MEDNERWILVMFTTVGISVHIQTEHGSYLVAASTGGHPNYWWHLLYELYNTLRWPFWVNYGWRHSVYRTFKDFEKGDPQ